MIGIEMAENKVYEKLYNCLQEMAGLTKEDSVYDMLCEFFVYKKTRGMTGFKIH